jgi:hypothetical protein
MSAEPLFRRVLGAAFDSLPEPIRRMHEIGDALRSTGEVVAVAPPSTAARLLARLLGLPDRAHAGPIEVVMERVDARERWTRRFCAFGMRTTLRAHPARPGGILERFGMIDGEATIEASPQGLVYRVRGGRVAGLPLPRLIAPVALAIEGVDAQGRFTFDVTIDVPLVGRIAAYRGHLTPRSEE